MAGSVAIEFVGAKAIEKALNNNDFAQKVFTGFIRDLADDVERRATIKAPTGVAGALRNSITKDRRELSKHAVSVGSNLRYAKPVEFGTRPHWPPRGSLARWAQLKLGATDPMRADFLIRRKISKVGTKAQPFLNPALDETRRNYFPRRQQTLLKDWGDEFVKQVLRNGGLRA